MTGRSTSITWTPNENAITDNADILNIASNESSNLFSDIDMQLHQQQYNVSGAYFFTTFGNVTSDGYVMSSTVSSINVTLDANSTVSPEGDTVSRNLMVPALMFFFGVFGNILALIILTVKPSKDSKATAFYHLVKALVYMDLFGIVATSPVTIVVYLNDGIMKTGGKALCHYFSFMLMLAGNATVFTVLVMAGERFLVSKFPFQYSRVVRPLVVNLTVGIVWAYSCIVAILPILGVGQNKAHWPQTWCFFDYRSTDIGGEILSYHYAITNLLAIMITIILNITVIRHVWSMRRSRLHATFRRSSSRSQGQEGGSSGSGPDSELRMVVFLMAIIVVFSVCYAPLMVSKSACQFCLSETSLNYGPKSLEKQAHQCCVKRLLWISF
ncbi:prostaglandin E2 receptor EP4 subtype [Elysia marginata]|uniref:Prostaglandin E2 receptor EP4 subtype n=1 Tax=Elysia marginata TaxID=1093978 RepID=A0AAV4GY18_9GAST|nr:prostaglandin E2 receptor EP4 subtype [Elysia marginata]